MAKTFESGSRVSSGYYVNARSFELVNVEKDGSVLPGKPGGKFVRIPTLVAMAAAPALGGLFVVALPFIGFGVAMHAVVRAFAGSAKEVAATVATAPMPAGSTALTGTPSEKEASGMPEAHPETEKLAKEIEVKRNGK